jgi:hypothetical protein
VRKLTDRLIRTGIYRDGCRGMSFLAVGRWRGCGTRGSTPRGGTTVLCVDSISNQLVFSSGRSNGTMSLPVLLFLANVLRMKSRNVRDDGIFWRIRPCQVRSLSYFLDFSSNFFFHRSFWYSPNLLLYVCVLVFVVLVSNWSVHRVSYEP